MGPYFTKNGSLLGPYLKTWGSLLVLEAVHLMNKELSLMCQNWRTTTSPTRLPALTSEVVAPVCCQVPSLSHTASHSLCLGLKDKIMMLQNFKNASGSRYDRESVSSDLIVHVGWLASYKLVKFLAVHGSGS